MSGNSKSLLSISLVLLITLCVTSLDAMIFFENQTKLPNKDLFFMIELPNRKQKKVDFKRSIILQELGSPKTLTIKIGASGVRKMAQIIDPAPQATYIIRIDKEKGKKKLTAWPKPKK